MTRDILELFTDYIDPFCGIGILLEKKDLRALSETSRAGKLLARSSAVCHAWIMQPCRETDTGIRCDDYKTDGIQVAHVFDRCIFGQLSEDNMVSVLQHISSMLTVPCWNKSFALQRACKDNNVKLAKVLVNRLGVQVTQHAVTRAARHIDTGLLSFLLEQPGSERLISAAALRACANPVYCRGVARPVVNSTALAMLTDRCIRCGNTGALTGAVGCMQTATELQHLLDSAHFDIKDCDIMDFMHAMREADPAFTLPQELTLALHKRCSCQCVTLQGRA